MSRSVDVVDVHVDDDTSTICFPSSKRSRLLDMSICDRMSTTGNRDKSRREICRKYVRLSCIRCKKKKILGKIANNDHSIRQTASWMKMKECCVSSARCSTKRADTASAVTHPGNRHSSNHRGVSCLHPSSYDSILPDVLFVIGKYDLNYFQNATHVVARTVRARRLMRYPCHVHAIR
jgi:hypothetical protein